MLDLIRFETKIDPYAIEAGMYGADVTVGLYCGTVLLDQRTENFCESDREIREAVERAQESMADRFGSFLNEMMRKEGYTL